MKRLWKQEWKYYLFFVVIMTVILSFDQDINWLLEFDIGDGNASDFIIGTILYSLSESVNGYLIQRMVLKGVIGILVFKAAFFWLEKDSYGREFLQTLPVTRLDRMVFHLVMDSLVILISVTCSWMYLYCVSLDVLKSMKLALPGFATGIFLRMAVIIGYLLFILCLINMLESLFVGGVTRIAGTAGNIFIGYLLVYFVSELFKKSEWIQHLCGFFVLDTAGIFSNTGSEEQQLQDVMNITVYYKGEPIIIPEEYSVYRFFSNSDMGWYMGHLAGYVVLAVLLAATAVFLVRRQEQSKRDFYFAAGRYLTSGLISVAFCVILLANARGAWHVCVIVLASVLLFVLLSYWMDTDRKPLKKQL